MDSDSDSGGSHISSTPPRHHQPPTPPPPQPPPLDLFLSTIRRTNPISKPNSTNSRPILKLKPSTKKIKPPTEPNLPEPEQDPVPPIPITLAVPDFDLPFRIRRHSDQISHNGICSSIETLPAGGLCRSSKFASFAKTRGATSLNFESTEDDTGFTTSNSVLVSETPGEVAGSENSGGNVKKDPDLVGSGVCSPLPAKVKKLFEPGNGVNTEISGTLKEGVKGGCLGKVVRKHPNLIGSCDFSSSPAKRPKCGNEGNFVRLNINGYGRKRFAFKGRKKNPNAFNGSRRSSYRRSKRKPKTKAGGGEEEEEDGFKQAELEMERTDLRLLDKAILNVRNDASDDNLVKLLKLTHGYDSFRDGQLEAIKLVLGGKSGMVILPTGAGKSLCYQLPALVLPGVTLVISPLIALMIDQLKQLPPVIRGGMLSSSQTLEEMSETLRLIHEGALKVLFVSPERLLNSEFTSIFSATSLISLVVIDEAHCISEWSHNFRPSYMRLRASLLHASLGADCILAMTATATTKTLHDVMSALEIPPTNLIQMAQIRDNLQLSVSTSGNRMKDLMALLNSSPYAEVGSIIIYCKYQSETDTISKFLCDSNIKAKSYHGGIPAKDRRRTQELFCLNKIRVVVATVAFGMGLDKSDVGAVIHFSLPESLEEYVQEIGRAGRDGRLSHCHLFFDDITYFKLRSLMHSDGIDQYAVNRFLSQLFIEATTSPGRTYSLVKDSASRKFDMKEEVMLTILTRLELGEVKYLRLLPSMNVTCTLNFHKTSPELLADKDTVIAAILKKSEIKGGQYVFDIPTVAYSIRVQAIDISNHLQILKLKGEVTYELKDPAYCYTIQDAPKDICSLAGGLTKWLSDVESCKVRKIDTMFNAAVFATKVCDRTLGCTGDQHTPCLQKKILEYFEGDDDSPVVPNKIAQSSPFLRADIKVFLQSNSHTKFTPRAIARIMHGIASPAFPSITWSSSHFWGRYMQTDFKVIMEAAQAELMLSIHKNAPQN